MKTVIFNALVAYPLFILLGLVFTNFEVDISFSVEDIPDLKRLLLTILFCIIVEDFCFHMGHRVLHMPFIYGRFHKQHHEFKYTIGISTEYSHPIDYTLAVMLPSGIGPLLLGKHFHAVSYIIWNVMRIAEGADGHCGYEFSFSPFRLLPFSTSATYHGFHHVVNVGNFSSWLSVWDTLLASNTSFYKQQSRLEKKAKEILNG